MSCPTALILWRTKAMPKVETANREADQSQQG
jgi:hypothetical protein